MLCARLHACACALSVHVQVGGGLADSGLCLHLGNTWDIECDVGMEAVGYLSRKLCSTSLAFEKEAYPKKAL
jgi:hypothetical protein